MKGDFASEDVGAEIAVYWSCAMRSPARLYFQVLRVGRRRDIVAMLRGFAPWNWAVWDLPLERVMQSQSSEGRKRQVVLGLTAVVLVLGATAMVLAQQASDTAKAAKKAAAPLVAKRAQAALLPFKASLKGALMGGIKSGGPLRALSACQAKAPELTAAAAKAGVEVGRTSHRVRNPKNAPDKWVRKALAGYIGKKKGDGDLAPYVVKMLPDGRAAYAEPIFTGGVCLTCHGENLAAPVQEAIRVAYPEDQAVGFKPGEFRGLFWAILTPDAVIGAQKN